MFLLTVPVMVALLVLGPRLLPEYRDPHAGRPDLPSAALSLAAMLALVYGLKRVAQDGVTTAALVAALLGLGLGVVFVRRQLRLADPLIDLSLFRIPGFSAALATYGIGIFVGFGGFLFIPQYLQLVLGMTPLEAGLWTLPWALSFIVGSNATPILARRIDPAWLIGGGLVLATLGFAVLLGIEAGSGLPLIVVGSIAFSLGMSPAFTLTNDLIMGSAPPERAGAAAGVSETAAELGGALGIAMLGSGLPARRRRRPPQHAVRRAGRRSPGNARRGSRGRGPAAHDGRRVAGDSCRGSIHHRPAPRCAHCRGLVAGPGRLRPRPRAGRRPGRGARTGR